MANTVNSFRQRLAGPGGQRGFSNRPRGNRFGGQDTRRAFDTSKLVTWVGQIEAKDATEFVSPEDGSVVKHPKVRIVRSIHLVDDVGNETIENKSSSLVVFRPEGRAPLNPGVIDQLIGTVVTTHVKVKGYVAQNANGYELMAVTEFEPLGPTTTTVKDKKPRRRKETVSIDQAPAA